MSEIVSADGALPFPSILQKFQIVMGRESSHQLAPSRVKWAATGWNEYPTYNEINGLVL
ncbi:MAG TPA: hypothetical protein VG821_07350 [Rhizomicrobium sp.]|nr:hypothetical protein [Rhizomicrobium sp.]